jgi:hypothetical protein
MGGARNELAVAFHYRLAGYEPKVKSPIDLSVYLLHFYMETKCCSNRSDCVACADAL